MKLTLANLDDLNAKQDTLVSGTNIKTINSESILGNGDITISGIDATDIDENYVPTANGDGTWEWKEQQGGSGSSEAEDISYDNSESCLISTNVQNALDELANTNVLLPYPLTLLDWEQGSLNDKGEVFSDDYYWRIRSPQFITIGVGRKISFSPITSDYYLDICYYDENYNFIRRNSWINKSAVIIAEYPIIKLIARYKTNDTTIPSDYYKFNVTIEKTIKSEKNVLFKGDNYSTEEQVIGRWIDGKPLYQRSYDLYSYIIVESTWTETSIIIENAERIINCKTSNEGASYLVNSKVSTDGKVSLASVRSSGDNNRAYVRYITIQYTKTTDTASTPIQTSLLNSDEVQAMIDASMGTLLGGEG